MPRLPSGATPLDGATPPPIRTPSRAMATDDEENPIIVAINARRAGSLSRADMVQQLVTHVRKKSYPACHSSPRSSDTESSSWLNKSLFPCHSPEAEVAGWPEQASTWDRAAAASRALDQQVGGHDNESLPPSHLYGRTQAVRSSSAAAGAVLMAAQQPRTKQVGGPAVAGGGQEGAAGRDAVRAEQRGKEQAAAEARAQARADEARAQARAAVSMDQERIREQVEQASAARLVEASRARKLEAERAQAARMAAARRENLTAAAAEMEHSQAVRIAATKERARVAAPAGAEAEIARIRHREQRAEAARRAAEKKQAEAQEQATAALAQAKRERARVRQLEREHAGAQAEAERFRMLEEQWRSELIRLQEQGQQEQLSTQVVAVPAPVASAPIPMMLEPEPEPEPPVRDSQLTIESDAEWQPEPEPWSCSWCTDPNVLHEHRMPGPAGTAELCPACGVEFEALEGNPGGEEHKASVHSRLFVQAPHLQRQRAAMSSSESFFEQEISLRLEASSRRAGPDHKAQNPIALRTSSPTEAGGPKWLAWATHSNNSTNSLAVKPVPRQPPARFVSPRAGSSRSKSPRAAGSSIQQEPSTRELKRFLFTKGLLSTGSREELLQRCQESQRREEEERMLLNKPKKKSAKMSVKTQKNRAAQLAELSPRFEQGRARAISARKESVNRRTETSFSPRRQVRGESPRRNPTKSPRKSRPTKSARASAKLHDRHREKLQQEIIHLGLDAGSSVAEVREEKRRRAIEEAEEALVAELSKRSVHSVDWRREAAKETKSSMGAAAYGSVRQLSEAAEDNESIPPHVRGERMHRHAQRYAEKRAALIGRAEEEASAKARDGWTTACGSSRARSKQLAAKRPEGCDLSHRAKQKVEMLKPDVQTREGDTKTDKTIAPKQRSTLRDKPYSHTPPAGKSGYTLTTLHEVETAAGAAQQNDSECPALLHTKAEELSPLPGFAGCLSQQSAGGENIPPRRLLKRRPSEILAEDLARLESNLADLKQDVVRAPGEGSPTQQHGQTSPASRGGKHDGQKQPRSAAATTASQRPDTDEKGERRISGNVLAGKSPRSRSLEQKRATAQTKADAEHPMRQLPQSASQQRLDALMGPDLAKVVDLLPQDQRQLQREQLLTLAEKAPANFDSPPGSPRSTVRPHSVSDS